MNKVKSQKSKVKSVVIVQLLEASAGVIASPFWGEAILFKIASSLWLLAMTRTLTMTELLQNAIQNSKFYILSFCFTLCVFSFSLNCYAMDLYLWHLPMPQPSEVFYEDKPAEINSIAINTTHLSSYLEKEKLMNFYKNALTQKGFEFAGEMPEANVLSFMKENRFLYVMVQEAPENFPHHIFIVSSPRDISFSTMIQESFSAESGNKDFPGRDSDEIPRYPNSVRRLNIYGPYESAMLFYESPTPIKDISAFYQKNMEKKGWHIIQGFNPQVKEVEMLMFEKEDNRLNIMISPFFKKDNVGINMINITKNIEKLMMRGEE